MNEITKQFPGSTRPSADDVHAMFRNYLYENKFISGVVCSEVDDQGNVHAAVRYPNIEVKVDEIAFISARVKTSKTSSATLEVALTVREHPVLGSALIPPKSLYELACSSGFHIDLDEDWLGYASMIWERQELIAALPRNQLYMIKAGKFYRTQDGQFDFAYFGQGKKLPEGINANNGTTTCMKPHDLFIYEPISTEEIYFSNCGMVEAYGYLFKDDEAGTSRLAGRLATADEIRLADEARLASPDACKQLTDRFLSGDWLS